MWQTMRGRERRQRAAGGFTLVELLVVIGIIGLPIGILLPVLGTARDRANTVKCLANLHQCGLAFQMYLNAKSGWIPPAAYQDADLTGASPPPTTPIDYNQPSEGWPTILVSNGYGQAPWVTLASPPTSKSMFVCPLANDRQTSTSYGSPVSRVDPASDIMFRWVSQRLHNAAYPSPASSSGTNQASLDTSYGVNGTNTYDARATAVWTPPCRCCTTRCRTGRTCTTTGRWSGTRRSWR